MKLKLLVFILLVGAAVRLIGLTNFPSGFQNDEASFFFNAIALKSTGHDEDHRRWPIYLNSFIDPKPALYSYLQIPFIVVFGETTTAARLPAAILGWFCLILFYLIAREMVKPKAALVVLTLATISPWFIVNSRGTQEVIMSTFFSLGCLYAFLLFCKGRKIWVTGLVSWLTFGLAIYSYHSAKIFLPLLLLTTFCFFTQHKLQSLKRFAILGLLSMTVLLAITFLSAGGLTRFSQVSVFSQANPQLILEEESRVATPYEPLVLIRFFNNKLVNYGLDIINIYFKHFTPEFLFIGGGLPNRYVTPFHGLMYLIELPLLITGIVLAFKDKSNQKLAKYFTCWLLIAPLAAALTTQEVPSSIRAFMMLFPSLYFVSVGINSAWQRSGFLKWPVRALILFGYGWGMLYFANQYLIQQPHYHPWNRNYADQQLAQLLPKFAPQYTSVRITREVSGDPYIYLALAHLFSINEIQQSYPTRLQDTFTIGKYTFTKISCKMLPDSKILYAIPATCPVLSPYQLITTADYKDHAKAYALVRLDPEAKITPEMLNSMQ